VLLLGVKFGYKASNIGLSVNMNNDHAQKKLNLHVSRATKY
jgi:hypothetical protein